MSTRVDTAGYTPTILEVLAEEKRLTDEAEQAVAALLSSLLLQADPAPLTAGLSLGTLRSLIKPVLMPVGLAAAALLIRRAVKLFDYSSIWAAVDRAIEQALREAQTALDSKKATATQSADVYDRVTTGPEGADAWAQEAATTLVTTVVEQTKGSIAASLGLTHKRWLTELDPKVRRTHRLLEGQELPLAGKFCTVAGNELSKPGDKSAPLGEWLNCRCRLLYFIPPGANA